MNIVNHEVTNNTEEIKYIKDTNSVNPVYWMDA